MEIPPDFEKLPVPKKDKKNINQSEQIEEEIENLFKSFNEDETTDISTSTNQSAEEFVLKKIILRKSFSKTSFE